SARNVPQTAKGLSPDAFGGLENVIYLAVGARVCLTNNIWKAAGLNNGAGGTVVDIVFGAQDPALPLFVVLEMDVYNGPPFLPDRPRTVAVAPL
ncbi:hypothetical protein DFJ73DRAFT_597241, partial [Zopfochytrium polystomum]